MNRKRITSLIALFLVIGLNAQIVEIVATHIKGSASKNTELKCTSVRITAEMKITKVEGDCNGIWIVKDHQTIHKFSDNKSPIGTVLAKGTYYVYPYINKGKLTASVTVTLEGVKQ